MVSVFENHICFSSGDFGPDHILQGQIVCGDGNLRSGGGETVLMLWIGSGVSVL